MNRYEVTVVGTGLIKKKSVERVVKKFYVAELSQDDEYKLPMVVFL